jgi:serine/threonine protein kinase
MLGLLGTGSFSNVYEIKARAPLDEQVSSNEEQRGERLATKTNYAMKILRADSWSRSSDGDDEETRRARRAQAGKDLAEEARLLSRLPPHDNIISLIAVSDGFYSDPASGFLVLERLHETLHDVLERWRRERGGERRKCSLLRRLTIAPLPANKEANTERGNDPKNRALARVSSVGIPLCRAMAFLHRRSIIFRDLSPSNVGFDVQYGTLKLFDFGTARVFSTDRTMTKCTGTPRYSSPEGLAGETYGLPADVYSFSVVLWEVTSHRLVRPYALVRDVEAARRSIARMRYRPPLHHVPDRHLRELINSGWDPSPDLRPPFALFAAKLESLVGARATSST